ncbi:MAG TPA: M24 family metallopeptidase, partial [Candidatus Binatia bacterium]|nr:M24 family metallopeptidase [Candidatus Binatia bacterium]
MAITLKKPSQIEALRAANRLVAQAFRQLEQAVRPGVRLADLDDLVTAFIESQGAKPLYKGYRGSSATQPPFPGTICASINEEICHGLPDRRRLREGDVVGIDIGLRLNGWCGDACVTYAVGQIAPETQRLLDVTRECLALGIEAVQPGARLTDIGAAIQQHAESH